MRKLDKQYLTVKTKKKESFYLESNFKLFTKRLHQKTENFLHLLKDFDFVVEKMRLMVKL